MLIRVLGFLRLLIVEIENWLAPLLLCGYLRIMDWLVVLVIFALFDWVSGKYNRDARPLPVCFFFLLVLLVSEIQILVWYVLLW